MLKYVSVVMIGVDLCYLGTYFFELVFSSDIWKSLCTFVPNFNKS